MNSRVRFVLRSLPFFMASFAACSPPPGTDAGLDVQPDTPRSDVRELATEPDDVQLADAVVPADLVLPVDLVEVLDVGMDVSTRTDTVLAMDAVDLVTDVQQAQDHVALDAVDVVLPTPGTPALRMPANGANTGRAGTVNNALTGTALRPIFRWTAAADATHYELQITSECTATDYGACPFTAAQSLTRTELFAQPSTDLPVGPTQPVGTRYFWRVRACNSASQCGAWSPTRHVNVGRVDHDYDGDGYSDLAVGSPQADPGGVLFAGSAAVFMGSPSGSSTLAARVLEGQQVQEAFGWSLASAGDLNADGFGDLIVGAYGAAPGGRAGTGRVTVYLGSASGIPAAPSQVLEGAAAGDQFGISVAAAGDVNGDGFGDILVGAYTADPGGRADAGTASVFLGHAAGVLPAPARVLEGVVAYDAFGFSVAGVGDLNGDGFDEVLVGAHLADPGGLNAAGSATVFLGSAAGTLSTGSHRIDGTILGATLGMAVAGAGDLNGDGLTDLLVGVNRSSPGGRAGAGSVSVWHGTDAAGLLVAGTTLEGPVAGEVFGTAVAPAGDVNDDGYRDVLVGTHFADPGGRTDAGKAVLFLGSATGLPATPALTLEGTRAGDHYGVGLSSAGDLNGDGYGDVLIGAYRFDPPGRTDAGSASVYHGSRTGLNTTADTLLEGLSAGDGFGISVAMGALSKPKPARQWREAFSLAWLGAWREPTDPSSNRTTRAAL